MAMRITVATGTTPAGAREIIVALIQSALATHRVSKELEIKRDVLLKFLVALPLANQL